MFINTTNVLMYDRSDSDESDDDNAEADATAC